MLADDPVSSENLLNGLLYSQSRDPTIEWQQAETTPVRLSTLRRQYEENRTDDAFRLLRKKVALDREDRKHAVRVDDPNIQFQIKKHFLDFLLVVSKRPGLRAIIPPAPNHAWSLTFDLRNPYRQFSAKHGILGFDPSECMVHIGQCGQDLLWMAWVPKERWEAGKPIPAAQCTSSALRGNRMRCALTFLACSASKIPDRQVHLMGNAKYGKPPQGDGPWKFKHTSNLA